MSAVSESYRAPPEALARHAPSTLGLSRSPEDVIGASLVGHASGIRNEFHRHSPRLDEIQPAQAGRGSFLHQRRLAQQLYAISPEMRDRGVKIGNVEADVVAADVAVLWNCILLILNIIFKQFDRRTIRAFQHPQLVYL